MTKEWYDGLSKPFEENKKAFQGILYLNKGLTYLTYALYPVSLIWLAVTRNPDFWKVLLVPAAGFIFVTIFRYFVNAKRPYEIWDVKPLIPRDKKGQSFPSRHTFSIFIIAMAELYVWKPVGIVLIICGIFLASARVIGRVHFVKDVLAGALIAVGIGYVGMFLI